MPSQAYRLWLDRGLRERSGSAFDLAEIIESLTVLSKTKPLLLRDRLMLLACEISEVIKETKSAAEERIDGALHCRR